MSLQISLYVSRGQHVATASFYWWRTLSKRSKFPILDSKHLECACLAAAECILCGPYFRYKWRQVGQSRRAVDPNSRYSYDLSECKAQSLLYASLLVILEYIYASEGTSQIRLNISLYFPALAFFPVHKIQQTKLYLPISLSNLLHQ